MNVVVLGQSGMLGSMVSKILSKESAWKVGGTQSEDPAAPGFFDATKGINQLDVIIPEGAYVINCIGITSWKMNSEDPASMQRAIKVNSAFPQELAQYAERRNLKVIHMSTDGVFSGKTGPYNEDSISDCSDAYGKSKVLGEAVSKNVLNIRTSIVGPSEVGDGHLAKFLANPEGAELTGYTNHVWHGVTTLQFAKMCQRIVLEDAFDDLRALSPTLHFAPNEPVTKFELYKALGDTFRPDIKVAPGVDASRSVSRELVTLFDDWSSFQGKTTIQAALKELSDHVLSPKSSILNPKPMKKKLAFILGIRPDIIRASLVLRRLFAQDKHEIVFIWSGQHYSDNLKDVFFRDLDVPRPSIELGATGNTDAEVSSAVITKLYPVLEELKPDAALFLGDTNTVMGSLAAAQLNIPVVHFEGCMHSYDWRMPEEKYRSTIDGLADVIYTYFPEYKHQGIARGLNPKSIVEVGGNPIVEILDKYYTQRKEKFEAMATPSFFAERGIEKGEYYLSTWHRRENVHIRSSFEAILKLMGATDRKIYLPLSYRTQKQLIEYGLSLPSNVIMVDPIGYTEMLVLMNNARGVITDSGTVVEETCVLQIPSLQMRKATERPQVYDVGSSVKFDPAEPEKYPLDQVFAKLESLVGKTWENPMGDGRASERIANDILRRLDEDDFRTHAREDYHLWTDRSYREDGLSLTAPASPVAFEQKQTTTA